MRRSGARGGQSDDTAEPEPDNHCSPPRRAGRQARVMLICRPRYANEAKSGLDGGGAHWPASVMHITVIANATLSQRCWLLPIVGLPNIGKISQHTAGSAPWTALVRSDPIRPNSFLAGCVMSSLFS